MFPSLSSNQTQPSETAGKDVEPELETKLSWSAIDPSAVSIVYNGQNQQVPYRKPFAYAGAVPTGPATLVCETRVPSVASRATDVDAKVPECLSIPSESAAEAS